MRKHGVLEVEFRFIPMGDTVCNLERKSDSNDDDDDGEEGSCLDEKQQ